MPISFPAWSGGAGYDPWGAVARMERSITTWLGTVEQRSLGLDAWIGSGSGGWSAASLFGLIGNLSWSAPWQPLGGMSWAMPAFGSGLWRPMGAAPAGVAPAPAHHAGASSVAPTHSRDDDDDHAMSASPGMTVSHGSAHAAAAAASPAPSPTQPTRREPREVGDPDRQERRDAAVMPPPEPAPPVAQPSPEPAPQPEAPHPAPEPAQPTRPALVQPAPVPSPPQPKPEVRIAERDERHERGAREPTLAPVPPLARPTPIAPPPAVAPAPRPVVRPDPAPPPPAVAPHPAPVPAPRPTPSVRPPVAPAPRPQIAADPPAPRAPVLDPADLAAGRALLETPRDIGGFVMDWRLDEPVKTYVDAAIVQFATQLRSRGLQRGTPEWEEAMATLLFDFVQRPRPDQGWPVAALAGGKGLGLDFSGQQDSRVSGEHGRIMDVIDQPRHAPDKHGECSEQTAVFLSLCLRAGLTRIQAADVTATKQLGGGADWQPIGHVCAALVLPGRTMLYDVGMHTRTPQHQYRLIDLRGFSRVQAGNAVGHQLRDKHFSIADRVMTAMRAEAPDDPTVLQTSVAVEIARGNLQPGRRTTIFSQTLETALACVRQGRADAPLTRLWGELSKIDLLTQERSVKSAGQVVRIQALSLAQGLGKFAVKQGRWAEATRYYGTCWDLARTQCTSPGLMRDIFNTLDRTVARSGPPELRARLREQYIGWLHQAIRELRTGPLHHLNASRAPEFQARTVAALQRELQRLGAPLEPPKHVS